MRWIRKNFSTVLLLVTLMIGISLLLYPTISDYWNSFHQSRAIAGYAEAVAQMDEIDYEKIWNDAVEYNKESADTEQSLVSDGRAAGRI